MISFAPQKGNAGYEHNINILPWISGFRFFCLYRPFTVIYQSHFGLNYLQIFITQIIFAVAIIVFEIPGGVFADLFNRRISMMIGALFTLLSPLLYWLCPTFLGFCFAEFFMALSYAFFSGCDAALLYESTKVLQQDKTYLKNESIVQAFGRYAEGISAVIGGFFASLSILILPFTQTIMSLPNLYLTYQLKDKRIENKNVRLNAWRRKIKIKLLSQLNFFYHHLSIKEHNGLWFVLLYSAAISTNTITTFWLLQVFLKKYDVNYILIGLIWLLYSLFTGFIAQTTQFFTDIFSNKKVLIAIPLLLQLMVAVLGLTQQVWFLPFLFIAAAAYGPKQPIILTILNTEISSNTVRASILSVIPC